MSQESLVRLKQINNPELSGYILSVVTQGSQAAGLQYFRLSSPSAGTFLYDSTNNFYEQGFQFGYPSNIFLIDFYGTSNIAPVPYGKPYIYGFDIYGGAIFSSGNRVITTVDTGNFISYGQLLRTSGSLVNTLLKYCYPNLPTSVTNGNIENTFLPYGIDLNNEWLIGDDTIPSIDWQNRVLSGDWNVQSLTIGGQPVTTGGQNITGDFITTGQTGIFAPENIGLPTVGYYGSQSNGSTAGLTAGLRHEDALDQIDLILGLLAPAKPLNLSQSTFLLTGRTYSAYMQGSNTLVSNVVNNFRFTGYATGFYNGAAGTLSGFINGILTGQDILTTGNDVGNYTGLTITTDADYWGGTFGKAGFWYYLNAQVSPISPLNSGMFTTQLVHSQTGPTNIITGYCDFSQTAKTVLNTFNTGTATTRMTDGVISLAPNDQVLINFNVLSGVGAFYANPIAQASCSQLSTVNVAPTGAPASGTTLVLSTVLTAANNAYTTGATINLTAYNSAGQSFSIANQTNVRVDTVSNQQAQRTTAGSGLYPTIGFNALYNNNISISGNEELQMINGALQYPPSVDYRIYLPSGVNYTNLPAGTYLGYRWAMFNMGQVTNASNVQVTFNNANNFGSSAIVSDLLLYVQVSGQTAGWINGNSAYPGVGNPTNNGDSALVVALSLSTVKLITFGSVSLTGPVYIRVGIPSGSNKNFSSISLVQV
jgi:hypothetical protein